MKKNRLIDFLIIVLVYIALSCIPFSLFIKDEKLSWLILTLQIVTQIMLFVFVILFLKFKSELNYSDGKINIVNTLLLIPTLAICFSNLTNLYVSGGSASIAVNVGLFLRILLTILIVVNEEIIFRLIFINNLEIKNKLLVILLTGGVFGLCHITHFLSTFDPADLLVIVYTFLLGLLLGFAYLFTNSIYPCIVVHFLFNLFNNILFPYFELKWMYFLITGVFVISVAIYVTLLYFFRMKKQATEE